MMHESDVRRWLAEHYPQLSLHAGPGGRYGVWQDDTRFDTYECRNGFEFGYLVTGRSLVFDITHRIPGGWICDEVLKRDPRLWQNPGNMYHEAFLLSQEAERNKDRRDAYTRERGEKTWEAMKRNEKLMNRVFSKIQRGDMKGAAREFTLEELYKNAVKENPREMRDRQFWRAVKSLDT
jgi:hypothetical protein